MTMKGPHEGLAPAFDLSRVGYFMDFALVPIAVIGLWLVAGVTIGAVASFLFGAVIWTLSEYWIHRLVFHGPTRFEPMHDMHHRLPKDMIGVASWGTFLGFGVVWAAAQYIAGTSYGSAFTAGLMAAYLFYCAIHVRMHHGKRDNFGRYVQFMYEHHAGHHRGGCGNFGVSTHIWDVAFGSYRK